MGRLRYCSFIRKVVIEAGEVGVLTLARVEKNIVIIFFTDKTFFLIPQNGFSIKTFPMNLCQLRSIVVDRMSDNITLVM